MRGMNLCISLNIPHRFCRDDVHIVSTTWHIHKMHK